MALEDIASAAEEITGLAGRLSSPDIVRTSALDVCEKYFSLTSPKDVPAFAAACVLMGYGLHKLPMTVGILSKKSAEKNRYKMGRKFHKLCMFLSPEHLPPQAYVPLVCSEISSEIHAELSPALQNRAIEILDLAALRLQLHKNPAIYAAVAVYVAAIGPEYYIPITQRQTADAMNVTEVTIHNKYKELSRCMGVPKAMAKEHRARMMIKPPKSVRDRQTENKIFDEYFKGLKRES